MTKRRERDPKRIAQLLASEVTGRSAGPLGRLAVVDAEPAATPSAEGSLAYRIALEEAAPDGGVAPRVIGVVHLHRETAVLSLPAAGIDSRSVDLPDSARDAGHRASPAERDDVAVVRDGDRLTVEIHTGAAVKPAVDVLTAIAEGARTDAASADNQDR